MQHLETNDVLSVILDEHQQVSAEGIILSKTEAILENERFRRATVYAVPEFYTHRRNKEEKVIDIRVRSEVRPGDRVLLDKYAGITMTKVGDQPIALVRMHEVVAVIEES